MRRKLLAGNLALLALAGAGLWKLRVDYRRARERYRILSPAPAGRNDLPPPAPASAPAPVQPAAYLDAAANYVFSPDRNPTVVVEPPKVKPRPTLPLLFGVMSLGGGPIAIMAEKQNAPHKTVRLGEMIGEFKLLGVDKDAISLEWDGQAIQAHVSDVLVRPSAAEGGGSTTSAAAAPAAGGAGATLMNTAASGRPGEYIIGGPTQTASGTIYTSPPGDTAPHGAVYQGKRKVVRQTPFGTQSWWEDVR
ncbi:MAG: hypothetical protein HY238_05230 [Acidobacteria bacterium]|nr:hypothetical protein [Acidobacteriota bacterium]